MNRGWEQARFARSSSENRKHSFKCGRKKALYVEMKMHRDIWRIDKSLRRAVSAAHNQGRHFMCWKNVMWQNKKRKQKTRNGDK